MNKIVKRLVAVTMAFFMVPGAMPSIAMAAPVTGTSDVTVETSTTAQIGSASSASAVTLDGEYTTAEVKADLRSIILLGKDKVVNVSKYGVSASDMDALVAEVLEENYVDGLIKVTCAVSRGMATYLVIERSEALVTAVDEMEAVTENAKASDEAESDAGASVAAASAYSISAYAAEDDTEGGGQEGAETTSGLTDEQKQQLTSLYALYLKTHEDYPQYLGVMDPYFYTKNTDTSPLGGMLVVAGIPQVAIDAGMVSYDDLFGCIMTFYLGNMATVKFYGEDLIAAKDEALNFVKNSGAKTYVDKLMVLMDWLSNRASFNMPYIMNQSQKDAEGKNITMMKAPSGNEPVNEYLGGDLEAYCEEVLTPIFKQGAMKDGREEGLKVYYAEYIKNNFAEYYEMVKDSTYQDPDTGETVLKEDGNPKTVYEFVYDMVYSQAYQGYYDGLVGAGTSDEEAKQQAAYQADRLAVIEAEYQVALATAQALDNPPETADAVLNISILNKEGESVGTGTMKETGESGSEVTFKSTEIESKVAEIVPSGYELAETNEYRDTTAVCGGEPVELIFNAVKKAETAEAKLIVRVVVDENEFKSETLVSEAGIVGDTHTFAADDIQKTAETLASSAGYELTGQQKEGVTVPYGQEGSVELTAVIKTEGNQSDEEPKSDDTPKSDEELKSDDTPVIVENSVTDVMTQNEVEMTSGNEVTTLAEGGSVHEAAMAYVDEDDKREKYAEKYAEDYASNVAPKYAAGLAPEVVGSWNGNLVGALCLDSCVCKSYTYAYNYIIQWMNPDVYGKNGASTDLSNADNWKSPDDLFYESKEVQATGDDGEPLKDGDGNPITTSEKTFSTDAGYVVDSVRITYNKATTMFGEVPENFSSDHYWSAVKVDGEWYYIDSCYADIYIECMMRSRVETDGYINNLYFMISDASAREMYDGYFDSETGLDTLYDSRNSSGLSDDTSYEHTWFSYAKSQVYSDGSGYYYMFDDTDALNELGKKGNSDSSAWEEEEKPTEYKLVYRPMDSKNSEETGGDSYVISADTSVQVLIDVNNGTFYNGEIMEESALLKDLYSRFQEYTENYPGVYVSMAYADGIAYMSIGNTILAYDVNAHTLTRVLEYNKVYAQRDMDNAFGGMAFTVVDKDGENTLSASNPPISAINIFDGKMTVSLATNYAFISGKKDSNDADDPGYAFQETNYNASYVNYSDYGIDLGDYGGELDGLIEQQDNDNDEFMWAANFVDTIKMSDLTASEHSYEAVTVDPTCGIDGYTENRCTTCGRIEDGTRKADEGTALEHHYIHFTETYYTKEDAKFKTGETFVCADCLHSVNYDDSDDADNTEWDALQAGDAASGHVYDYVSTEEGQMELSDDHSTITISGGKLVCPSCDGKTLDFLSNDNSNITADGEATVELDLEEPLTLEARPAETSGDNEGGAEVTYVAEGTYKDVKFTVSASAIDLNTPAIASATNEIDGVKVTWDAVDGATSYQVYRKDDNTGKWSKLGEPLAATSYTDTTVESGETYAYSVEAIAKDGNSSVSSGYDETGCSVRYIAAPVITKIENSNGQMNVTWKKVPGAENYRLFVKCGKNWWDWDAVADTTGTSATFKGSSKVKFTSGKEYQFTVRCMDTDKTYTSAYDKTGKSLKYIAEPVISSVSNTADGLKVSWKSVGGAEKYRLFVKTGKNWWDWTSVSDTTGTSATFKGISKLKLADGKTYQFTVRCVTADGKSYTSSYDKNGKSLLRMSNPVVTLANNTNGITVKWGKISGATGYYVYRKAGNADWQKIATIKSGATVTYTDAAVKTKNNTEYSYTVRSYNGSTMSDYTGKKIIRLTTPTISSATNNKSKVITVKWNKNNSVTGYQVSYKTGNTEKTVTIKGKTNVSTTIKNLTKNKTYTVKVRSYRSLNGVNYYSGWSTAKNVKIKK